MLQFPQGVRVDDHPTMAIHEDEVKGRPIHQWHDGGVLCLRAKGEVVKGPEEKYVMALDKSLVSCKDCLELIHS